MNKFFTTNTVYDSSFENITEIGMHSKRRTDFSHVCPYVREYCPDMRGAGMPDRCISPLPAVDITFMLARLSTVYSSEARLYKL